PEIKLQCTMCVCDHRVMWLHSRGRNWVFIENRTPNCPGFAHELGATIFDAARDEYLGVVIFDPVYRLRWKQREVSVINLLKI
ncbi:MAG: hypothetical protein AAF585_24840, partial [Verrucomicrobiota bacterium]